MSVKNGKDAFIYQWESQRGSQLYHDLYLIDKKINSFDG